MASCRLRADSPNDWLIVARDVADRLTDIEFTLASLRERFQRVLWVPGNHELWAAQDDAGGLRGEERYRHIVERCRALDVLTPEDTYPVWEGPGGPAVIAPLFLLYDYSWRPPGAKTKAEALAVARDAGIVCVDEVLLDPAPYGSREAWCEARLFATERRLATVDPALPTVLMGNDGWVKRRLVGG